MQVERVSRHFEVSIRPSSLRLRTRDILVALERLSIAAQLHPRSLFVVDSVDVSKDIMADADPVQSVAEGSKMSSLSRRACYKCGNVGHYAEVCSSSERLCYNCKQPGGSTMERWATGAHSR